MRHWSGPARPNCRVGGRAQDLFDEGIVCPPFALCFLFNVRDSVLSSFSILLRVGCLRRAHSYKKNVPSHTTNTDSRRMRALVQTTDCVNRPDLATQNPHSRRKYATATHILFLQGHMYGVKNWTLNSGEKEREASIEPLSV